MVIVKVVANRTTYIYALLDPRTGEVRYVGKTVNIAERLYGHKHDAVCHRSKTHNCTWIRSLLAAGYEPEVVILEEVDSDSWAEAEAKWIAHYRSLGARLNNHTDGGEGAPGCKRSEETITALRQRMMGNDYHKYVTPEGRERINAANRGRVDTPETREKRAASHRGKPSGMLGHKHTESTREKISAGLRLYWQQRKAANSVIG